MATAYNSSPFYRSVFQELGLTPADIQGVAQLEKLPVVTRADIKVEHDRLLTQSPRGDWLLGHTSGTTGSPLSIWYDRHTCIMTNAVDRRHKIRAGMTESDWVGVLLGRTIVPANQESGPFWRTNRIQRQVWFSSFHMTAANLDEYTNEIRRRELRFLEGYPSTLYVLARHVLNRGMHLPMEAVISSSETLHPLQRSTIEDAFQCRLFDFYAQAERVVYAGECEAHEGKHVAEEYGYLEIVDDSGRRLPDGEVGYIVGTSLHNRAMPFLRYKTGDMSAIIPEPCACGRAHRRLRDVATKAEDIVVTPDGRCLSPSVLTHPFKPFESIEKSQIIQTAIDEMVVKVVPGPGYTDAMQAQLVERLRERVGSEVEIRVELVADIGRESSGKYRWVISNVDSPYEFDWE